MAQKESRHRLERRIARAAKRKKWREVKCLLAAVGVALVQPQESLLAEPQRPVFSG